MNERNATVTPGSGWMYRLLIWLLKKTDIRVFYVIMSVFIIPVTLIVSPGARLTYHYYHRRRKYGVAKAIWATYRNHCIFGQTVIDKFAMYAGHRFEVKYTGLEKYNEIAASDKPLIQLSAHIGCNEIIGYSLRVPKKCNVLVYGGENEALMNYRKELFEKMNMNMIPVGTEDADIEEMVACLERGEALSVFADRFSNPKKVVTSKLLGYDVKLARGPFSLAVNMGVDVYMVTAMKEKDGSYSASVKFLEYDKTLSHREQRQQLADQYTAEIDRILDIYPLQWFNYFNLWIN